MRASIVAALPLLLSTGIALGADLPRGMPSAVAASGGTWSGFYIGLNGGGGMTKTSSAFDVGGVPFGTADNSLTGWVGGAQIGYNWQRGAFLFGVETDFQFSGMQGSLNAACPTPTCGVPVTASFTEKMPWFGTVRGRLGLSAQSWLLYATGGYAYAHVDTDATATVPGVSATLSQSEFRSGWTAGGGIEIAFSRNWTAKVEYLYLDLGRTNTTWTLTGVPTFNDNSRIFANVVRGGVNYKF